MDDQSPVSLPDSEKPKRKYTTLSLSHEVKRELEQILYSSGKAQTCNDLLKELIALKKAQLNAIANKTFTKEKEAI